MHMKMRKFKKKDLFSILYKTIKSSLKWNWPPSLNVTGIKSIEFITDNIKKNQSRINRPPDNIADIVT